jgi:MFS family permease
MTWACHAPAPDISSIPAVDKPFHLSWYRPGSREDIMSDPESRTAGEEWRAHWTLVLASALGASLISLVMGSLGVFIAPLEHEFGWTRASITAGLSIYAAFSVICAPLLGVLVDRYGPRRVALSGVALFGIGFALFGTVSSSIWHWLALWIVFALCAQIARPLVWVTAVSSEFKTSRGLALGVMLAGMGLGGIITPMLTATLITHFGWRLAYAILGLCWGGLAAGACYLFFYGRSDRLRRAPAIARVSPAAVLEGMTAREGLRSPAFAKLAVATLFSNSLLVGIVIHQVPLLSGTGLSRDQAVWLVSAAGAATMASKVVCGYLADRMPGNILGAFFVALPMLSCLFFLSPSDSVSQRAIPVIALSLAGGGQTHMLTYLTGRYFGLRAYGTMFGFVAAVMAAGIGIGPPIAGFVYDHFHSYDWVMIAGFPMSIVAASLILWMGRYPDAPEPVAPPANATPAAAE